MFSKNELKLAYGLIIYFLFVGVLCYAAFPPKSPQEPIRLKFEVATGNVIFEHKKHLDVNGYGLSCGDCHHTLSEDEYDEAGSCSECGATTGSSHIIRLRVIYRPRIPTVVNRVLPNPVVAVVERLHTGGSLCFPGGRSPKMPSVPCSRRVNLP